MKRLFLAALLAAQLTGGAMPYIRSVSEQIRSLLPTQKSDVKSLVEEAKESFKSAMAEILSLEESERSEANTLASYDIACGHYFEKMSRLHAMTLVEPDDSLRAAAQEGFVELNVFMEQWALGHPEIYQALVSLKGKPLSKEGSYFLTEELAALEEQGLHLDTKKREELAALSEERAEIHHLFQKNIQESDAYILVSPTELTGLDSEFIESKQEGDQIRLGCDYPTYFKVMQQCSNGAVRKALYMAFMNRAYPENEQVLLQVIEKNAKLAQLLGHKSFAGLDVARVMAKTPEKIDSFLSEIAVRAKAKAKSEFEVLTRELPEGVSLSPEGKVYPWDLAYVSHNYLKKHHAIDHEKIAEYFPLEKTMASLINVYEQFFDLKIAQLPADGLWSDEVRLLAISDKQTRDPLGYLILDLFPRKGKYSHACEQEIIKAWAPKNGKRMPALCMVVANFRRPLGSKPALLTLSDARTFFHEFGHAIHEILGAQPFMTKCGTNVKLDFVELPSQILEEWLWDRDILKLASSHYVTGEPLPDSTIDALLAARNVASGMHYARQGMLSSLSLDYYRTPDITDTSALHRQLAGEMQPHVHFCDESHFQASFGHLTNYGAKYYSYLWAKVFALDCFEVIQGEGLLNPEIGRRFREVVLGAGGGRDPNEVLREFLGREPRLEPFFKNAGLEDQVSSES